MVSVCAQRLIICIGSTAMLTAGPGAKETKLAALNRVGFELKDAILRGDPGPILRRCRDFNVAVGEDSYMSCAELRKVLRDPSSTLYCEIFDTRCYRVNMEKFATDPEYHSRDLLVYARQALSVRERLARSGEKVKIRASFNRLSGKEQPDMGSVFYELTEPPEAHGELSYPHIGFAWRHDSWVLTSLFPPFP
jgi:hypothetical protein